mgnify:CR=1 FL=1
MVRTISKWLMPTAPRPWGHTIGSIVIGGSTYANDAQVKNNKVTWRGGFDLDVGRGLLYGSVASGYKQGGFGVEDCQAVSHLVDPILDAADVIDLPTAIDAALNAAIRDPLNGMWLVKIGRAHV